MKAAGENRYGHRDATMILIAFRHGLRPVEVCNLKWDSIDLAKARIHVNRAKNGEPSTHPLSGVELRALRRLKRESIESPFVFVSERGSPFTTAGYRKIARLGWARFSYPVHPHTFRHACGMTATPGRFSTTWAARASSDFRRSAALFAILCRWPAVVRYVQAWYQKRRPKLLDRIAH